MNASVAEAILKYIPISICRKDGVVMVIRCAVCFVAPLVNGRSVMKMKRIHGGTCQNVGIDKLLKVYYMAYMQTQTMIKIVQISERPRKRFSVRSRGRLSPASSLVFLFFERPVKL